MSIGLPGTGVGGLFYIMGALWMPVQEGWRAVRRRPGPRQWRAALLQGGMALSIVAGIWLAGWLLGLVLLPGIGEGPGPAAGAAAERTRNVLQAVAVVGTIGILTAVLAAVQLLRLVARRRPRLSVRPEPLREAA
ncbi:MAG TPA: hypothetical protein VMK65_03920 [Longimicrobiales bacterium]|nr:hypothetical protein [Longimicrobiales bacterium]